MKVGHNVNWIRILAEGFAIVVSILLAFAIDAWAKFNQDGATEIEQLLNAPIESLDKEFIERVIEYSWIVNAETPAETPRNPGHPQISSFLTLT